MWDLVRNPEERFSHNAAQMSHVITDDITEDMRKPDFCIYAIYMHLNKVTDQLRSKRADDQRL